MVKVVVPSRLVESLRASFEDLVTANNNVATQIRQDSHLPAYTSSEDDGADMTMPQREEIISSIARMFMVDEGEYQTRSGFLCASEETIESIKTLNKAKDQLKKTVKELKTYHASSARNVGRLLRDGDWRTDALVEAMRITGTRSLDLRRCYARIRILDETPIRSVSWTWATTQMHITRKTYTEVIDMIDALPDSQIALRQFAYDKMSPLNTSETFAVKVSQGNSQLRANYSYWDVENTILRKQLACSGVLVAMQNELPKLLWRKDPGKMDSIERDSSFEKEPIIPGLNLYRYK